MGGGQRLESKMCCSSFSMGSGAHNCFLYYYALSSCYFGSIKCYEKIDFKSYKVVVRMQVKKEKKGEQMAKWTPFLVTQRHLWASVHVLLSKVITIVWSIWDSQYHTSILSYLDTEQSFLASQIDRHPGRFSRMVIRIGKPRNVSQASCRILLIFPNLPHEMWNDKALETCTGICYHTGLARHRDCTDWGLLFFSRASSFTSVKAYTHSHLWSF